MRSPEAVQRFKAIQADRKITQADLCKELNINPSTFYRWEKKDCSINARIAAKLSPKKDLIIPEPQKEPNRAPIMHEPLVVASEGTAKDIHGRSFNPVMHLQDVTGPLVIGGYLQINPRQKTIDRLQEERDKEDAEKEDEKEKTECQEQEKRTIQAQEDSKKAELLKANSFASIVEYAFFKGGTAFFGSKFEPKPTEKKEINEAIQKYLAVKGCPEVPAGVELALVLGMYSVSRVATAPAEPNTLFSKLKGWWGKKKRAKFAKELNKSRDEIKKSMEQEKDDTTRTPESEAGNQSDPFSVQ